MANVRITRPEKVDKQALTDLYDILNELYWKVGYKKYKHEDLFYTEEALEEAKKDPRNTWI
jgi:hypothetical protein